MKSSYFILDITDPEQEPTLLAEITFDDLGFTTSYPTAFFIDAKNIAAANDWYLVLGSGLPSRRPCTVEKSRAPGSLSRPVSDQLKSWTRSTPEFTSPARFRGGTSKRMRNWECGMRNVGKGESECGIGNELNAASGS